MPPACIGWRGVPVLPPRAGLSLKPQHYAEILESSPRIGFFEIRAENYMGAGGPPHHNLEQIRARYPLSLHSVGLSTAAEADRRKSLVDAV